MLILSRFRPRLVLASVYFTVLTTLTALASLTPLTAWAEQADTFGNYKVHYSAVNSTLIQPEVASQYKILRSRYEGVINIALQEKTEDGYKGISAALSGTASNLLGQQQKLKFTEVREGSAIYYLCNFHFSNEESFKFQIDVQPEGSKLKHTIKFQQKFFTD
ncbi:MAG TPA: DUF4426 domain-containing protein [Pseudomonadales bacterium]